MNNEQLEKAEQIRTIIKYEEQIKSLQTQITKLEKQAEEAEVMLIQRDELIDELRSEMGDEG